MSIIDEILNKTVSGADNSDTLNIENSPGFSIHAVVGAGLTATLKLQGSNTGSNFVDIAGTTESISGSAIDFLWDMDNQYYEYVRLNFSSVTGSGTAVVTSKKKRP